MFLAIYQNDLYFYIMQNKIVNKNFLLYVLLISLFSTTNCVNSQSLKGLYVDDFYNIIGNQQNEDKLLTYAQSKGFNYLILYNTTSIHRNKYPLDSSQGSEVWRKFILKAKSKYGLQKIGVVGEKAASFFPVKKYNQIVEYNELERIDVYNLEFEFWNKRLFEDSGYYCNTYLHKFGYECNNEGAFKFYLLQLKEMQKLKGKTSVEIETYIGNPSDEQLAQIAKVTDRVLIHYYRENTDNMASYKLNRLKVLQGKYPNLKIAPIFSSRENHLGPWLKTHQIDEVHKVFFHQLKLIKEINLKSLNFDGHIWYRYSNMPKNK